MQFIPLARKVLSGDTTLSNNAIVLLFSKKYYFLFVNLIINSKGIPNIERR